MYIATIPNRDSPPAILLREGYREDGKVKTRTLANLSKLPTEAIAVLRQVLQGKHLVSTDEAFEIVEDGSRDHGHADAVLTAMRRLGFSGLINSRPSRQRDLVVAMVAARVLKPQSKLATTRWWSSTTLTEMLGLGQTDEDELYEAMDWLLEHQASIEKKLAARHLAEGGLALYDLTSSYFEGVTCPLAELGYNRDGKKGMLQVNYGLLTNQQAVPVAVSVFKGNSGDPKTLLPQVDKIRAEFGIKQFVLVGDRGMITQKQVDALRDIEGCGWISALRPGNDPFHAVHVDRLEIGDVADDVLGGPLARNGAGVELFRCHPGHSGAERLGTGKVVVDQLGIVHVRSPRQRHHHTRFAVRAAAGRAGQGWGG